MARTLSQGMTGQDVRALVNHVGGEYLWVKEMMDGRTVADVGDRLAHGSGPGP